MNAAKAARGRSAQQLRHGRDRQARISRRHVPAGAADYRERNVRRRGESQPGEGILHVQPEAGVQGLRQRELQLEADRFAVEKANKDLDTAKTKLQVLDEFTKPKMLSTLESAIQIAKAKWDSGQNSHELELEKLAELDDQIAKCTITAPQDGIVKYAHVMDGRGDQEFIVEEGTVVRERQAIIRLPNADSMRVNLTVNESLVQYVRPGLAAAISPVGFGDRVLHGTVEKVNQYAEPTGWRQANVKEYKALRQHRRPAARSAVRHDGRVTIRCAEVPERAAGARAGGLRPRQQVLLLRLQRRAIGKHARSSPARRTTSSSSSSRAQRRRPGGDESADVSSTRSTCRSCRPKKRSAPCRSAMADGRGRGNGAAATAAGPDGRRRTAAASDSRGEQPAEAPKQLGQPDGAGPGDTAQPARRRRPRQAARPPRKGPPNEAGRQRRRSAQGLRAQRRNVHALRGVSFDVPEGDYISIMGPSGSGKSTLLNLLGCLDRPTAGRFMLGDVDVSRMSDDQLAEIRATRIGFIFQSYNLLPALTVVENIEVPLYYSHRINAATQAALRGAGRNGRPRPAAQSPADAALRRPAAARRHRPQPGERPRVHPGRRADRQPRLAHDRTKSSTCSNDSTTKAARSSWSRTNPTSPSAPSARSCCATGTLCPTKDIKSSEETRSEEHGIDTSSAPRSSAPRSLALHSMFTVWLRTLQLSVKSLLMHPLRSSLTVLGIFIGVSSVIWLLAIGRGDQPRGAGADRQPRRAQHHRPHGQAVRRSGAGRRLRPDARRLPATAGHGADDRQGDPDARSCRRSSSATSTRKMEGRLVGTTPDYAEVTRLAVDRGRFLTDADIDEERNYCVLAAEVADELFPFGEPIGEEDPDRRRLLRVVGVMKPRAAVGRHRRLARGRECFPATSTFRSPRSGGAKAT